MASSFRLKQATAVLLAAACAGLPARGQTVPDSQAGPEGANTRTYAAPAVRAVRLSRAQAALLRRTLADSRAQGLPATKLLASDDGSDDQATLVAAALDYARAVHAGRLAPEDFLKDWGLRPAAYDPAPAFYAAVADDRLESWLASLPPPYPGYDGLRKGLVAYREIVRQGGWPTLSASGDLAKGASGAQVARLRRRLAIEAAPFGDADAAASSSDVFDETLAEQVRDAQKRYGLRPTGVVDAETLAALNVSATHRVRQIEANLERWRWLPPELPGDRIQVNIAAAVLTVFHDDQPTMSMRAVTGRPGDETPMLSSTIRSIVLNPPWNVPSSIAEKELWPKEHAHPGYLARESYKIIKTPDGGVRLQQAAGPKSALGRVKFDFANPYGVYLHDTPNHGAFDRYGRMVSHGCVRLQKPVDLAELLLKDDPNWGGDAVPQAIAAGDTVRATLPQPIAVYLMYWTAFAAPDGRIAFRADPYGWDEVLASKLEGAPPPPISMASAQ